VGRRAVVRDALVTDHDAVRMIRLIVVLLLLGLTVTFFLQNQEQEVTLRYLFGLRSTSVLIYKPVLGAFAVGILVTSILLFPAWVRGRIELRRKTRALQEAQADLEALRQTQERTLHPPVRVTAGKNAEDLPDA